jgi:hypothetical protein
MARRLDGMETFEADLAARNDLVTRLVFLLATGQFDALQLQAPGSRVNASQIAEAVKDYGHRLVPLPPEGVGLIDYVACLGSQPRAWSVVVPLFTEDEGRSDLSMELTMTEGANGATHSVSIDDLRVR